ncbi:MAG: hypothetical protein IPN47_12935 [Gemmatimonadetes bacterium]|nr:hypothetical protein [Gemmatimonadota bacterium]
MVTTRVPQWLRQALVFSGAWHVILGVAMVIAPGAFFALARIAPLNYLPVWQGVGVMTAVMGWPTRSPPATRRATGR